MHVLMLLSNPLAPDPRVEAEAEALVEEGHRVTVLAWGRGLRGEDRRRGFRVVRVGPPAGYGGVDVMLKIPLFYAAALPVALRMKYDVVHAHDLDTAILGVALSTLRDVPLIYDAHESYPDMVAPIVPPVVLRALERLDAFVTSRAWAVITVGKRLAGRFKRMGARRVVVVGNWKARRGDVQWKKRKRFRIAYVGVLTPDRHVEDLIRAFCNDERFEVIVGGYKGKEGEIREMCSSCDNCTFLGRVPGDRVYEVFRDADAVFYSLDPSVPNNYYSAPNSLFLALAAGRPLLCLDHGEVGEIVREYRCGEVFPTNDPAEIRKATMRLMERDDVAECVERAYVEFNWDRARERLIALYSSIPSPKR